MGSMTKDGIFDFLEKHAHRANLAALEGNLVEAYARTGIQQSRNHRLLNSLISFLVELQMARMSGGS